MLQEQAVICLRALRPSTYTDQGTDRLTEIPSEVLKFVLVLLACGKVFVFHRDTLKIISISTCFTIIMYFINIKWNHISFHVDYV